MFRKILVIALIVLCVLVMVWPVMAQGPFESPVPTPTPGPSIELPETAVEAVGLAQAMLSALGVSVAGFVGFTIVKIFKEHIPWLSKENREKIGTGVTRALVMVFNVFIGVLVNSVMVYATKLDETGLWTAIVTIITVIGAPVAGELFHRASKGGKAAALHP